MLEIRLSKVSRGFTKKTHNLLKEVFLDIIIIYIKIKYPSKPHEGNCNNIFLNKLTNIKTTRGENISWQFFKIKEKNHQIVMC